MSAARVLERELRSEHERELTEVKEQLDDRQRKLEATKARTRVLENSVSELRGRMTTLLDKAAHDDQLISALTVQKIKELVKFLQSTVCSRPIIYENQYNR